MKLRVRWWMWLILSIALVLLITPLEMWLSTNTGIPERISWLAPALFAIPVVVAIISLISGIRDYYKPRKEVLLSLTAIGIIAILFILNGVLSWHLLDPSRYSESEVQAIVKQHYNEYGFRAGDVYSISVSGCTYSGHGEWKGSAELTYYNPIFKEYRNNSVDWCYFEKSGTVSDVVSFKNIITPNAATPTTIPTTTPTTPATTNKYDRLRELMKK